MEELMKKAISEFKKLSCGEIRTISVCECSYFKNKPDYALFLIEYSYELGAEYQSIYIALTTDGYVNVRK